jgi:hypothetical protein
MSKKLGSVMYYVGLVVTGMFGTMTGCFLGLAWMGITGSVEIVSPPTPLSLTAGEGEYIQYSVEDFQGTGVARVLYNPEKNGEYTYEIAGKIGSLMLEEKDKGLETFLLVTPLPHDKGFSEALVGSGSVVLGEWSPWISDESKEWAMTAEVILAASSPETEAYRKSMIGLTRSLINDWAKATPRRYSTSADGVGVTTTFDGETLKTVVSLDVFGFSPGKETVVFPDEENPFYVRSIDELTQGAPEEVVKFLNDPFGFAGFGGFPTWLSPRSIRILVAMSAMKDEDTETPGQARDDFNTLTDIIMSSMVDDIMMSKPNVGGKV